MRRAGIVTILDQFGQRELEQILVEPDGLLDVAAHQGGVVQTPCRRGRALVGGTQVLLADALPLRLEALGSVLLGHRAMAETLSKEESGIWAFTAGGISRPPRPALFDVVS